MNRKTRIVTTTKRLYATRPNGHPSTTLRKAKTYRQPKRTIKTQCAPDTTIKQHAIIPTDKNIRKTSITYPPGPRGFTINVSDMKHLNNGEYINDTIINVCLAWAHRELINESFTPAIRILDTMWYEALNRGVKGYDKAKLEENMERMRKWFPSGHPFDKTLTIIPVCQENHWFSIACLDFNNCMTIMVMDSLNTSISNYACKSVLTVLALCRPDKTPIQTIVNVQQQPNLVDCGVYLIHNSLRLMMWAENEHGRSLDTLESFLNVTPMSRKDLKKIVFAIKRGEENDPELKKIILGNFEKSSLEIDVNDVKMRDLESCASNIK